MFIAITAICFTWGDFTDVASMVERATIKGLDRSVWPFNKTILEPEGGKAGNRQTNQTGIVFVIRIEAIVNPAPAVFKLV